jgi:hypothetical protein
MASNLPYNAVIPYAEPMQGDVPTQHAWVPTLPTIAQTREAAINSIQQNFAALNAGSAPLPYVPNAGGVTMTGYFGLYANATAANHPVPLQQLQSYVAANNGVTTYNGRTGAVTGNSGDITGALGYTPANAAGQTFSGNVTVPAISAKTYISQPHVWSGTGTIVIDANFGSSQIINPTGPITISGINNYTGTVLRVFIYPTNVAITWPATGIVWPMTGNAAPNLAAGPLKGAVITFTYDGSFTGWHAASYSVY